MNNLLSAALVFGLLCACSSDPGSGACGPDNCNGCCDSTTGICNPGDQPTSCGAHGASCDVCVGAQVCSLGKCDFSSATGGGSVSMTGGGSGGSGGSAGAGVGGGTAGGATAGG